MVNVGETVKAQYFTIHTDNDESRMIRQAAYIVKQGGVIVYPTDSGYALGCQLAVKSALNRIRKIRKLDESHNMSLLMRDLSQLDVYAKCTTAVGRLLRAFTPGPYTFLLNARRVVPRVMLQPNKTTIGLRIPANRLLLALLEELDAPLMSTTLTLPMVDIPLNEPAAIRDLLGSRVDLIVDGGCCLQDPTTIVDLTQELPDIVREGQGDPSPFKSP
jgi:tRNA threonylcarbamoyl adenosine modification protein (Sua5/YciO/YrdC/YwlC family)